MQNQLNQKLCANNCVARWTFNSQRLASLGKLAVRDQENAFYNCLNRIPLAQEVQSSKEWYQLVVNSASVNACEENFVWSQRQGQDSKRANLSEGILLMNMPGTYNIKLALVFPMIEYFENNLESRPQLRILVNN
jgi:hypothetical protein